MAGERRSGRGASEVSPRRARPVRGRDGDSGRAAAIAPAGDIVAQLRSLLPALAPAEQRVGEVIVEDPARASALTITELASRARTSETTVIRFCRSVGVASYPALRLLVAAWGGRNAVSEQPRLSPHIDPGDDLESVVARVGRSVATTARETADRLDLAALEQAAEAIGGARRIDIYGVGASALVAEDLQRKLHRIGLSAWMWPDPHMALTSAANLTDADVVVAVSHSGATGDTLDPVLEARERGARVIAITNFAQSPIAACGDLVLTTVSDETTFRSGAMASRIAALVVVDCLFVAVAKREWSQTTEALVRTSNAITTRRGPVRGRR